MRPCNNLINTPPTLGSKGSEKTTEGRHPLGFLLSGPGAILSGRQSPPGGPDSASRFPRRYTLPFIALLAALTLGLLFLLPGGPLQAQDDGTIEYAENGMDPVATFTGTDPEDRMVYWSLLEDESNVMIDGTALVAADVEDHGDFTISADGVLSFVFPPDHEGADDEGTDNTYMVVVVASDDGMGVPDRMMGYKKVTVTVTDVDEPGVITLLAQQPQVAQMLTATLTDDDATSDQIEAAKWKWEQTADMDGPWTVVVGATAEGYTPAAGLAGRYLRATATYTDKFGSDKSEMAMSAQMVRKAPSGNVEPVGTAATRMVDENSAPGTKVGKPVTATDTPGDVLTYTLAGTDGGDYRIDRASGQITIGPRTMLDHDAPNGDEDMVTVTATDPSGAIRQRQPW